MQTFLPYSNFSASARVLDDKRLGKQRVECLQILKALQPAEPCKKCTGRGTLSMTMRTWPNRSPFVTHQYQCPACMGVGSKPRAWANHPATRMWRGYERALIIYLEICVTEWKRRGFEDTCWDKVKQDYCTDVRSRFMNVPVPPWLGDERLHASHRAALLYKLPSHYSQFNWNETPKQDYYWPV